MKAWPLKHALVLWLVLASIEGTVWEYTAVNLPSLTMQCGFLDGRIYIVENLEAYPIPRANAYYSDTFAYVWQCDKGSCGILYSFFRCGWAIEFLESWGVPLVLRFQLSHVGYLERQSN